MRVEVDRDACEANAVCAGWFPRSSRSTTRTCLHIKVSDVPAGLADGVRHAVRSCPKAALSLHE